MDKKYQQVQCWQPDRYVHLNVGVHPAGDHQLDGAVLPHHDTETGEGEHQFNHVLDKLLLKSVYLDFLNLVTIWIVVLSV